MNSGSDINTGSDVNTSLNKSSGQDVNTGSNINTGSKMDTGSKMIQVWKRIQTRMKIQIRIWKRFECDCRSKYEYWFRCGFKSHVNTRLNVNKYLTWIQVWMWIHVKQANVVFKLNLPRLRYVCSRIYHP